MNFVGRQRCRRRPIVCGVRIVFDTEHRVSARTQKIAFLLFAIIVLIIELKISWMQRANIM